MKTHRSPLSGSSVSSDAVVAPARRMSALARDAAGSVAILFGLLFLGMVVAVGCSIDYYSAWRYQSHLQSALDSGVLAASIAVDQGKDPTVAVRAFLDANFDRPTGITSTATTAVDATAATVTGTAVATVATSFLKILTIPSLTIRARSAATYGGKDLEVAIVFDTTGSMSGAKMTAAQAAAKALIDTVFTVPGTTTKNTHVKVGLVPFTDYVNVGTTYRGATWLSVPKDTTTTTTQCWNEYPNAVFKGPYTVTGTCTNDGIPYSCSWTEYTSIDWGTPVEKCAPVTTTSTWYGCVGSRAHPQDLQDTVTSTAPVPGLMDTWCPAPLMRLTTDTTALKAAVDAMWAGGETYIAPGLLWGWRLLSTNAPFADGGTDSNKVQKFIILMTDGANTHSPSYPWHWGGDVANANDILAKTCANVKAKGIGIFSIAFQVTDSTIKSILTNCATSATNYYDSATIADMQSAFRSIADKLSTRRLVY